MKRLLPLVPPLVALGVALCACAGPTGNAALGPAGGSLQPLAHRYAHYRTSSNPIQHIVLIVQENRTFNDLFATFPNAEGATTMGLERKGKGKKAKTVQIPLTETTLAVKQNLNHLYNSYVTAYRDGHMDAFNKIISINSGMPEGTHPYQYVNPADITEYTTLATDYALADHMFQTQGSGSFTAHQDLIRGGTELNSTESLVDDPTSSSAWGCTSPQGTKTSLLTTGLVYEKGQGPYPCTNDFPSSGSYQTLADLFSTASISWKYYAPKPKSLTVGALWNAFLVIDSIYGNQSEWNAHISSPSKQIFTDISNGALPQMSWVIPDAINSDHPGYASDTGPSWVTSIVNALGQSSYWDSTAVIVVWDDWGGFYDPVAPTNLDTQGGPGFRVGMIVASPYVPQNEISHTVYGFGSIIKFIEQTWGLPSLGTTDQTSTSISDIFNYDRKPRKFKTIPAKYSRSFFMHQKPSNLPVDTE